MSCLLREALKDCFTREQLERLEGTRVGIAGAGGIGSNVAFMLVRSGVRRLFILDHDVVEAGNLNRQQFFPGDVGRPKVFALRDRLLELAPDLELEAAQASVGEGNVLDLLPEADVWVEAMDRPESKRLLVEKALLKKLPVVACSGMAGIGGPPIRTRELGLLTLVGDGVSDISALRPMAPRVTACAALMADAVLIRLLQAEKCAASKEPTA